MLLQSLGAPRDPCEQEIFEKQFSEQLAFSESKEPSEAKDTPPRQDRGSSMGGRLYSFDE